MLRYLVIFIVALSFITCSPSKKRQIIERELFVVNEYSKGFSVYKSDDYVKIVVRNGQQEKKYLLLTFSKKKPENIEYDVLIRTPIKSVVALSSIHTAFLEALNEEYSVVGIDNINYHKSKTINQQFKDKKIIEVGDISQVNKEILLSLDADVVMTYPTGTTEHQLEEMGIPVVINAEHLEETPLGRAEWIKFMGYFYEKEELATKLFDQINKQYQIEKQKNQEPIKSIFSGKIYQNTWYVPGGKSYVAQLLQDAGFKYIWQEDSTRGSLPLSKENAFMRAKDADYWCLQVFDSTFSYQSLIQENPLYKELKSIQNRQLIYVNTAQVDYYGKGVLEPHILLQDLNKIQRNDTTTVYYHLLK